MTRRTIVAQDGCRLSVVVDGPASGPPLVLSNSLGTDLRLWDPQLARLAASRLVLRYDMRGHGASDVPAGDYSIDRLGQDVLAIMDGSGIDRASLAGISIGGIVSLWVAGHAPDRVDCLVLANTAARIGTEDLWHERVRVVRTDGMAALADATMARWFTPAFRQRQPDTVALFRGMVAGTSPDGYVGCCAALRDADLRPLAATLRAKTLVVSGAHDVATPPVAGRWLADTIPGATFVEMDSAHLSNVECADAFTEAMVRLLDGNGNQR
jgi:3-oxoadipate enol-lactonase